MPFNPSEEAVINELTKSMNNLFHVTRHENTDDSWIKIKDFAQLQEQIKQKDYIKEVVKAPVDIEINTEIDAEIQASLQKNRDEKFKAMKEEVAALKQQQSKVLDELVDDKNISTKLKLAIYGKYFEDEEAKMIKLKYDVTVAEIDLREAKAKTEAAPKYKDIKTLEDELKSCQEKLKQEQDKRHALTNDFKKELKKTELVLSSEVLAKGAEDLAKKIEDLQAKKFNIDNTLRYINKKEDYEDHQKKRETVLANAHSDSQYIYINESDVYLFPPKKIDFTPSFNFSLAASSKEKKECEVCNPKKIRIEKKDACSIM